MNSAAVALARQDNAATGWFAAAEDLAALAWLHEQERPVQTWCALRRHDFPAQLGVLAPGSIAQAHMASALDALCAATAEQRATLDDELAADYAAIYLTHALRASPCASVWLDEDQLMLQAPYLAVRREYRRHGVEASHFRALPDDHIANELSFVAHLLGMGQLAGAAEFLDRHVLTWVPQFTTRVAQRAATPIYAALAEASGEAVINVRQRIEDCDSISKT